MSKYYNRKVSKDRNHDEVADALRIGNGVLDLSGVGNSCPDLFAANRKHAVLFEVKTKDGYFYLDQLTFLANWPGYSAFCTSGEDALKIMKDPELWALTEVEKMLILRLVAKYHRDFDLKERERGEKMSRRTISTVQFETDFDSALV